MRDPEFEYAITILALAMMATQYFGPVNRYGRVWSVSG